MNRWKRFVAAFDLHGDEADQGAVRAFFRFVEIWRPSIRVLGGDVWNFEALRRKASKEEQEISMRADFDVGLAFIERFRPTHFTRGNHDERLYDLRATGHGPLKDLADLLTERAESVLSKLKTEVYPYHKRLGIARIGHLKVVHGFGGAGVTAARRHAQAYGSCLVGHFHTIDSASIEGYDRRVGRICGCLCHLDLDYNRAQLGTLRQQHGFAYGVSDEGSGLYHVWQAEEVGGRWFFPSDLVEVR